PATESAPSIMKEDEPSLARAVAGMGAALVVVAGVVLIANVYHQLLPWGGWAFFGLCLGTGCLLYHASADKVETARHGYTLLGAVLVIAGIILEIVPYKGVTGGAFLSGFLCMGLGLLFTLAPLRHETDELWREKIAQGLALVGAALALVGFAGGIAR